MRIPFPDRISYGAAASFAAGLMVLQVLERTDPEFVAYCFVYILLATAAFNIAGGISRGAGSYILFNALLTLIIGVTVKAALGEPAESNLEHGVKTMQVYMCGMMAMLMAAYIDRRLRPPTNRALMVRFLSIPDLRTAYIGSVILGFGVPFLFAFLPFGNGSIGNLLARLDQFLPLAIMLGTIDTINRSGGKKSITPLLAFIIASQIWFGMLGFSKQGMIAPLFCWGMAAAYARYELRLVNIIVIGGFVYIAVTVFTPLSQVGRGRNTENPTNVVIELLSDIPALQKGYADQADNDYGRWNYYNRPMGLGDRLHMLGPDDALISTADRVGFFGYEPLKEGFENLIPHFIWPNKPTPYFGNTFAHVIGGIADEDYSTGYSFGASADAYFEGGFYGIFIGETVVLSLVFLSCSWILGDARSQPVTLIVILVLAHAAPEWGLWGSTACFTFELIAIAIAFVCKYVLPIVSSLVEPKSNISSAETLPVVRPANPATV